MTARFWRVLEKPEKIFSTSLLAFSLIRRPSLVKNPVCPAEQRNRPAPSGRSLTQSGSLELEREGGERRDINGDTAEANITLVSRAPSPSRKFGWGGDVSFIYLFIVYSFILFYYYIIFFEKSDKHENPETCMCGE